MFNQLCQAPAPATPQATAPAAGPPPGPPDRSQWHVEPVKVFDNLYFVGQTEFSAWAVTTSAGIILVDTIFDYSVEDEVVGGLKKLGLDPTQIKYAIVSHGHGDHSGGAKYLQDHFGTRIILSAADWDLLDRSTGTKPKRDMVATDGQKLTLGDTTLTLYLTPGHTLGTISTIIPVKDGGPPHVVAEWGGTMFNWTRNRAGYITPERPDTFWFETYSKSAERFRDIVAQGGRRRADLQSHQFRRLEDEAAGAGNAQAGRSESVRDRQRQREAVSGDGRRVCTGGPRTRQVDYRCLRPDRRHASRAFIDQHMTGQGTQENGVGEDVLFRWTLLPACVIGFQQVAGIGWRNMASNAVRILQTLVLDDARSRLLYPIEHGPERPWLHVDDRVLDPRLVLERVGSGRVIALDDMNLGAMEVAGLIQPRLIRLRDDVSHQRVALPAIPGVAHPPVGVVEVRPRIGVEHAKRVILLVDDGKIAGTLKDLQRRREVRRTRHAGLKASDRRIGGRACPVVLLSCDECLRSVRNLPVRRIDNDAFRGRDAFFSGMSFDVDVRGIAYLPKAAEIWRLAVPQAAWHKRLRGIRALAANRGGQYGRCGDSRNEPHCALRFLPPSSSV